jgi:hypothetical protein
VNRPFLDTPVDDLFLGSALVTLVVALLHYSVRGVLPQENRSEITPPLPETLRGAIRQHLNTHLIGAGREV